MGDCDLNELKIKYGDKIVLKGNLHTTNIMLHGTVDQVIEASKKAIDDAAKGSNLFYQQVINAGVIHPKKIFLQ